MTPPNESMDIVTPGGHTIRFADEKNGSVTVKSAGGLEIKLDDSAKAITIQSGRCKITIDGDNIELNTKSKILLSGSDLELRGNNIQLMGNSVNIEAKGPLNLKGSTVKASGGTLSLDATLLEAKGHARAKIEGSGMLTLEGGLIKIN